MPVKSKLKMALAADKGTDFGRMHLKKQEKAARKAKASKGGDSKKVEGEWEDVEEEAESGDEEDGSDVEGEADLLVWQLHLYSGVLQF